MNVYNEMENDIGNVQVDISKGKGKIKVRQLVIPTISTLLLSFLLSYILLTKPIGRLEGIWVRQPDDNSMANGMMIEVKKENEMYVGEVVAIDNESGMPIGTFKWRGFQKDALNVFSYYDMSISYAASERVYKTGYALISLDGSKLTIYAPEAKSGAHQVWIKQ